MTRRSTAPKEEIVNPTPTQRKSVFPPILTGLAGVVVGAKVAKKRTVDRRDRTPVLPADAAALLARADAATKDYHAARGRHWNILLTLGALVIAGLPTASFILREYSLYAGWTLLLPHIQPQPAYVSAAAVCAVTVASVLRALTNLWPAGWMRLPWSWLALGVVVALWIVGYIAAPFLLRHWGYFLSTVAPVLLMFAQIMQDSRTQKGQTNVPKTFMVY